MEKGIFIRDSQSLTHEFLIALNLKISIFVLAIIVVFEADDEHSKYYKLHMLYILDESILNAAENYKNLTNLGNDVFLRFDPSVKPMQIQS